MGHEAQPVQLFLLLGPQVVGSSAALKNLASLLAPRGGAREAVSPACLLGALNEEMWRRHEAAGLGDEAPELSLRDVAEVKKRE